MRRFTSLHAVAGTQTRTTYLGQFSDDNAQAIVRELDTAGIVWWSKSSGRFAQILFADSWGTRLFVEEARLDEAREIAKRIAPGAV